MPKRKQQSQKLEDMVKVQWESGQQSWVLIRHIKMVNKNEKLLPNTKIKMGRHMATVLAE